MGPEGDTKAPRLGRHAGNVARHRVKIDHERRRLDPIERLVHECRWACRHRMVSGLSGLMEIDFKLWSRPPVHLETAQ
jgi:hypothetical protein